MKIKQLRATGCTSAVRKLLAVLLFLAAAPSLHAADVVGDTLEVRFRVGQSNLDMNYADNAKHIDDFVNRVKAHYQRMPDKSLKLDVYGGASPEGPAELNRRLGEERGVTLKNILVERLGNLVEKVTVINQGARWGAFYRMVEQSNEPWKLEVLNSLGKEPGQDEWKVDPREEKLRNMRKGRIWRTLSDKYLAPLRTSGSAVIVPMTEEERRCCDTLVIRDTIVYLPDPCPQWAEPIDHTPVIAVKTNFLLWGVIAPNAQVEVPLGTKNRWSLEGEVFWPWWIWNHNTNAHQCGDVGLELRYWLGNRMKHHLIDGWHIGLGVGAGYYDFEWLIGEKHKGYQGEYLNIYGNFGYQHRWGKRKQWAIDAGVGFGWIPTNYREYLGSSIFPVGHEEEPDGTKEDPHLMWQKTSWKHIVGLTHANITLAYIFRTSKKTKILTSFDEESIPVYAPVPEPLTGAVAGQQAQRIENQGRVKSSNVDKKADKAATKAQKKADKAAAKAQKKADKAAAKAQKNSDAPAASSAYAATTWQPQPQQPQDKKAAKAQKKAAKAAAKAQKKAAKAAQKQADREAKEWAKREYAAEKAAKKEAKAAAKAAKKAK